MVEIGRFELPTSAMRMQRSSQLSYIPITTTLPLEVEAGNSHCIAGIDALALQLPINTQFA